MTLAKNWTTRQVDYTNAFDQADLNETVYVEPPRGFLPKRNKDSVLHLQKSLYGLKQAPKFFLINFQVDLSSEDLNNPTWIPVYS